jgi:hypothetical protein
MDVYDVKQRSLLCFLQVAYVDSQLQWFRNFVLSIAMCVCVCVGGGVGLNLMDFSDIVKIQLWQSSEHTTQNFMYCNIVLAVVLFLVT